MDSEDILERVRDRYRSCNSYRDMGTVARSARHDDELIQFETYFLRPSYLRFHSLSYRDGNAEQQCELWSDGVHTRIRVNNTSRACPNVGVALAAMAGATLGLAEIHIPLLLAKTKLQFDDSSWFSLENLKYIGDAEINSNPCFVMAKIDKRSVERKVFIAKEDYSIRKEMFDFFSVAEESARKERELVDRERDLARKLNRTTQLQEKTPVDVHRVTTYSFDEHEFDADVGMDVFEFRTFE